jgi:hypothetical protein
VAVACSRLIMQGMFLDDGLILEEMQRAAGKQTS